MKDEIPLTPETIEFFEGYEKSAEEVYFFSQDEPQREKIRDCLDEALSHLSDREMAVLGFSLFWQLSNYKTGKILGLSREGVGKIRKRAIEKLRINFFEEIKKS